MLKQFRAIWSFSKQFEQFWSIFRRISMQFEQVWSILKHCWSILSHFESILKHLEVFGSIRSILRHFEAIWSILKHFETFPDPKPWIFLLVNWSLFVLRISIFPDLHFSDFEKRSAEFLGTSNSPSCNLIIFCIQNFNSPGFLTFSENPEGIPRCHFPPGGPAHPAH